MTVIRKSLGGPGLIRSFSGRKALVTGGVGFIGSNLARELVRLGAEVTLVDSMIPEYGGNLRNLAGIEKRVQVHFTDVRDGHSLPHLVRGQDFLFNLAGQTSHMDSMTDPQTDLEINARAQLSILEACRLHNPGIRIVFASTRQIYGRPDYLPVDEKHPLRPVDVNGINKLAGESYHLLYHRVHGIRSTVLRLTNTIGPRMRIKDARQTFVGLWIKQALQDDAFEVWGGGQLRDFTYVDDAVEAFLLAAAKDAAAGEIFNVGGTKPVTLEELAAEVAMACGGGQYVVKSFPGDRKRIDIGDFYADDRLIRKKLGWRPRTKLREALEKTFAYYRKEIAHYV
ncbi:NAD-dependent epimerase [Nibricoccus aquaticus]|uniref:NAD-dependent epimerase n=1 Tax=Nibricoccus aquaticus TaxID=2576891 RepID=A0A290Q8Z9_9BACT|nr:NAD-dependent epimerase/dehydratase family protein [Nibricoccus aquaticus]ATC64717.1 NAD-dependent epimerase [Nibricoccus aquaticus]